MFSVYFALFALLKLILMTSLGVGDFFNFRNSCGCPAVVGEMPTKTHNSHTHSHTNTLSHTHTHARTHRHPHTHTHSHSHTHTHSHTPHAPFPQVGRHSFKPLSGNPGGRRRDGAEVMESRGWWGTGWGAAALSPGVLQSH